MPTEAGGGHQPSRGYSELNPDFLEGQPVLFCALAPAPLCSVLCLTLEVWFVIFVRGCKQPFPHLLRTYRSLDKTTSVNK